MERGSATLSFCLCSLPSRLAWRREGAERRFVTHSSKAVFSKESPCITHTGRQAGKQNTKGFLAQPCAWCPLPGLMMDVKKTWQSERAWIRVFVDCVNL